MTKTKISRKGLVNPFLLILFLFLSLDLNIGPVNTTTIDSSSTITLEIWIYDVKPADRTVSIEVRANVKAIREYNTTSVSAYIGGSFFILCDKTTFGNNTFPSLFYGVSNTEWSLWGYGEAYPFDSYVLPFEISMASGPSFEISNDSRVVFGTTEARRDWTSGMVIEGHRLEVQLTRNPLIPFLQILLPIIACYYLLGATLILDIERLSERLRICLSLFIFAPTFMFAVQQFLPLRLSLSLPEFLLTNLLVSNAIFGIFSMIGNKSAANMDTGNHRDTIELLDIAPAVLSLSIFLALYLVTLLGRIDIRGSLVTYLIIQSYTYWLFLKIPREKTKRALLRYLVLLLIPIVAVLIIY